MTLMIDQHEQFLNWQVCSCSLWLSHCNLSIQW